jgi:hypothetical protein
VEGWAREKRGRRSTSTKSSQPSVAFAEGRAREKRGEEIDLSEI